MLDQEIKGEDEYNASIGGASTVADSEDQFMLEKPTNVMSRGAPMAGG